MLVYIPDGGRGTPQLRTAEDLGALSVRAEASSLDWDILSRTLRAVGAGEVAGDHAWLDIVWLRTAAGERDQDWHDGFTAMLDYANAHGWLSDDGRRVRAHVDCRPAQTTDRQPPAAISSECYRHVLGHFITGVTIVTAIHADEPVGFTCQSFGALSMDPPLVLLCPSKASTSWPKVAASGRFGVNVLANNQIELCRRFAVSGGDKFADVTWTAAKFSGAPKLAGTVSWLECEIVTVHEAGDHWIVVARVLDLATVTDQQPLTFFRGTLAGFSSHEPPESPRVLPAPAFSNSNGDQTR